MNTNSILGQYAKVCSGELEAEFEQAIYTRTFPAELQSACCMTLCTVWAYSNCDMQQFINYVNSPLGMAQVKGFQLLARHCREGAWGFGGKFYSGYVKQIWQIYKIKDTCRSQHGHFVVPHIIVAFATRAVGYSQIHISQENTETTHALGLYFDGSMVKLFDPTYGCVFFKKKSDFIKFLDYFFHYFYREYKNSEWTIFSGLVPNLVSKL